MPMKLKKRPTAIMEQSRPSRCTLDEESFPCRVNFIFREEATPTLAGFHAIELEFGNVSF